MDRLLDVGDAGLPGPSRLEVALADVDVLDQRSAASRVHLSDDTTFPALAAGKHDHVVTLFYAREGHF